MSAGDEVYMPVVADAFVFPAVANCIFAPEVRKYGEDQTFCVNAESIIARLMDLGTTNILFGMSEGDRLLQEWLEQQTPGGPVPSSYRSAYIEPKLPELVTLDQSGSTTAAYILYSYYRYDKASPEFSRWRDKAATLGFERAILDVRKSETFRSIPDSLTGGAWASVIVLCVVGVAVMFYWIRRGENKGR